MSITVNLNVKKDGILYAITNVLWGPNCIKLGRTTQLISKRLSNLQTALPVDCVVLFTTDILIDCHHSEKILHDMLAYHRYKRCREFFYAPVELIRKIFDCINELNKADIQFFQDLYIFNKNLSTSSKLIDNEPYNNNKPISSDCIDVTIDMIDDDLLVYDNDSYKSYNKPRVDYNKPKATNNQKSDKNNTGYFIKKRKRKPLSVDTSQ